MAFDCQPRCAGDGCCIARDHLGSRHTAAYHGAESEGPALLNGEVAQQRVDPLALAAVGHARHHGQLARHHAEQVVEGEPARAYAHLIRAPQRVEALDLVEEVREFEQPADRVRLRLCDETARAA